MCPAWRTPGCMSILGRPKWTPGVLPPGGGAVLRAVPALRAAGAGAAAAGGAASGQRGGLLGFRRAEVQHGLPWTGGLKYA